MRSTGFTVRLIRETEKPIAEVAWDPGINAGTLGNWVNIDRRRPGASQNSQSAQPTWQEPMWRWSPRTAAR